MKLPLLPGRYTELQKDKEKVWKLLRVANGLNQTSKTSYDTLNKVLENSDLRQSDRDPCLYIYNVDSSQISYVLI